MKIHSVEYVKATPHWEEGPRDALPEIAMTGRSNVGKSSLINFLLGRKKAAYVSKTPGKTQLIQFFLINRAFFLVDLPGYGYARKPKEMQKGWGKMIDAYLTRRKTLRAVALLIDIRRLDSPLDIQMSKWLGYHQIRTLFIATKGDKIARRKRTAQVDALKRAFGIPDLVVTSTLKKEGKEAAWERIGRMISEGTGS